MTATETREQAGGGLCTWVLMMSSGQFVYDPTTISSTSQGFDINSAYLWLSDERALEFAHKTPWIGASARVMRARP